MILSSYKRFVLDCLLATLRRSEPNAVPVVYSLTWQLLALSGSYDIDYQAQCFHRYR